MAVYDIIFSPTGGTKKVSDLFTKAFCGQSGQSAQSSPIDLTDQSKDFSAFSFHEEDICIVAVPSYGGRVPAVAVARLAQMKGNGARAVLIVVYGNRAYDDTFASFRIPWKLPGSSVWRRWLPWPSTPSCASMPPGARIWKTEKSLLLLPHLSGPK